jgi:hypothetical protein
MAETDPGQDLTIVPPATTAPISVAQAATDAELVAM